MGLYLAEWELLAYEGLKVGLERVTFAVSEKLTEYDQTVLQTIQLIVTINEDKYGLNNIVHLRQTVGSKSTFVCFIS